MHMLPMCPEESAGEGAQQFWAHCTLLKPEMLVQVPLRLC